MYEFNFIGEINEENQTTLMNYVLSNKIDKLVININSLGGSVASGVSLYNFLKKQTFEIITNNIGEVSSSAILLYLSGSKRLCEPISKFIIHPITLPVNGTYNYYQIQETNNILLSNINDYKNIVA